MPQVRALYTYKPTDPEELALEEGDIIDLLDEEEDDEGWLKGQKGTEQGLFPAFFVEAVVPEEEDAKLDAILDPVREEDKDKGGYGDIIEENDPQLAPGWTAASDDKSGRTYYYNEKGEALWDKPLSDEDTPQDQLRRRSSSTVRQGNCEEENYIDTNTSPMPTSQQSDADEESEAIGTMLPPQPASSLLDESKYELPMLQLSDDRIAADRRDSEGSEMAMELTSAEEAKRLATETSRRRSRSVAHLPDLPLPNYEEPSSINNDQEQTIATMPQQQPSQADEEDHRDDQPCNPVGHYKSSADRIFIAVPRIQRAVRRWLARTRRRLSLQQRQQQLLLEQQQREIMLLQQQHQEAEHRSSRAYESSLQEERSSADTNHQQQEPCSDSHRLTDKSNADRLFAAVPRIQRAVRRWLARIRRKLAIKALQEQQWQQQKHPQQQEERRVSPVKASSTCDNAIREMNVHSVLANVTTAGRIFTAVQRIQRVVRVWLARVRRRRAKKSSVTCVRKAEPINLEELMRNPQLQALVAKMVDDKVAKALVDLHHTGPPSALSAKAPATSSPMEPHTPASKQGPPIVSQSVPSTPPSKPKPKHKRKAPQEEEDLEDDGEEHYFGDCQPRSTTPSPSRHSPIRPMTERTAELERRTRERIQDMAKKSQDKAGIAAANEAKPYSFMYKECRSAIYPPTDMENPDLLCKDPPESQLQLEYIYGYNGDLLRYGAYERYSTNVLWLRSGEIIFPSSCVVVILSNFEVNEQRFFLGHDADVMALTRHPTCDICASAQCSRPAKICIFDATSQIPEHITSFSPGPQSKGVVNMDFSPCGDLLLCASEDDNCVNVVVWDWRKPAPLASLSSKVPRFSEVRWNPYCYSPLSKAKSPSEVLYTLVSGASRQIRFWTLTAEPEKDIKRQGNVKVASHLPGMAYRLDVNSGLFRKGAEAQDITCMCFVREPSMDPDLARTYVLTGTDQGGIYIWTQLEEDAGPVTNHARHIRRWLPKGRLVSALPDAHEGCVTDIVYAEQDSTIATCGKDGLVVLWAPSRTRKGSKSPLTMLRSVQIFGSVPGVGIPRSIAWDDDSATWVVGGAGCTICLLRQSTLSKHSGGPSRGDNNSSGFDGTMKIIPLIRGHTGPIRAVADHPTLPVWATVAADKTLRIWDGRSRKLVYINRLWDRASAVVFHPGGSQLAVGTEEGEVIILECTKRRSSSGVNEDEELRLEDWKIVARRNLPAPQPDNNKSAPLLSANGAVLTPLKFDGTVAEEQDTPSLSKNDRLKTMEITVLKYSPHGQFLAVASRDKLIHLLSVDMQYKRAAVFRGHSTTVIRMDFNLSGDVLQSNDSAREILFWDVLTGRQHKNPSSTRDMLWSSWTCLYGWPVQGIWPDSTSDNNTTTTTTNSERGSLPIVCRSHSEEVLALGEHKRVRLLRYPCMRGSASKSYAAHSSMVTAAAWLSSDTNLITCGGTDLAIYQWRHASKA